MPSPRRLRISAAVEVNEVSGKSSRLNGSTPRFFACPTADLSSFRVSSLNDKDQSEGPWKSRLVHTRGPSKRFGSEGITLILTLTPCFFILPKSERPQITHQPDGACN